MDKIFLFHNVKGLYESLACPKIVREKNDTYTYNRLCMGILP
jgi:hypothetical protein